jgi:hypothetical protein
MIEGHEQLKSYITNYYKGLLGEQEEVNFFTDESRTVYIPQVSVEDNNLLTALYSEDKVKKGWNTTKH